MRKNPLGRCRACGRLLYDPQRAKEGIGRSCEDKYLLRAIGAPAGMTVGELYDEFRRAKA